MQEKDGPDAGQQNVGSNAKALLLITFSRKEQNSMSNPKITKIENMYFAHQIENMGTDYNGFNLVYQKGATKYFSRLFSTRTDQAPSGISHGWPTRWDASG